MIDGIDQVLPPPAPLNVDALTPTYIAQKIMSENPTALLVVAVTDQQSIRVLHSNMGLELRSYMIQVAQAQIIQDIVMHSQRNDMVRARQERRKSYGPKENEESVQIDEKDQEELED